jgi:hypothetical protein
MGPPRVHAHLESIFGPPGLASPRSHHDVACEGPRLRDVTDFGARLAKRAVVSGWLVVAGVAWQLGECIVSGRSLHLRVAGSSHTVWCPLW